MASHLPLFLPCHTYCGKEDHPFPLLVYLSVQNYKPIPITITNVIETTPHIVMQKKGKVAESHRRSIMNQIYIVYSCNFINFRSMAFVMLFFFNFNNTQPTQHKDNLIYKFYNISKVIHHGNNL